MKCIRSDKYEGEVAYTESKNMLWRCHANLAARNYSCRQWQICGKPCIHALHPITIIRGADGEVDQYLLSVFLCCQI
jgi:hypothetical protein